MTNRKRVDIALSLDIDWAPDEVIEYSLALLESYNVKSTLFMTHKTCLDTKGHEIGVHPNFTSMELEMHLEDRMMDYPLAKGIRSHSLFFTERLRPIYKKYGYTYQSNVMMYMQPHIKPYYMSPYMLEMPLYWMDNFYIEMENDQASFDLDMESLKLPGLKLFNFHPVHIFLNTYSFNHYEEAKKYYHDPDILKTYRNQDRKGIKDIFEELLQYIRKNKLPTHTLCEIALQYKGEQG